MLHGCQLLVDLKPGLSVDAGIVFEWDPPMIQ